MTCVGMTAQGEETVGRREESELARLAGFAARINYFNRLCPQEKVYLHLDNTAYFQGETIWYAATVVDAATGGEAASKVLYVELLSPTGVVLKQQKLKVVNGRCHGSFPLIDTSVEEAVALRGAIGYPSGYYQIRAYTRAQLNFDDAAVFSRVIPVYKAPEKEGDYAGPVMTAYSGKEAIRPEPSEKLKELNIQFFPEGGHLIAGTECRIAFKATDKQGHGVTIESLTDADGKPLAVPLQHNGMGCFELTPGEKAGRVKAVYQGKSYSFRLPEPETAGISLRLERPGVAMASRGVSKWMMSVAARGEGVDSVLAYTVTSRGQVCVFDTLHLATTGTFSIPDEKLPAGVCQLTLYDTAGDILAQRLFFADGEIPTQTLTVTTESQEIRPFGEVKLSFQTEQSSGKPVAFSLAVRDAADYGTAYHDDIRTYMLLSSELKGLIEDPEWYFEREEGRNQKEEGLDLLMMVQGWTRYNWRQMAGVEPFEVRHYTESQLVLDGWALNQIKETPLENVKIAVRLTSPDRQHRQETTVTTDSLGYWSVGIEDFEGEWDLYMETRQKSDRKGSKTTRVRLERSSKPALKAYEPLDTWLPGYVWSADTILVVGEQPAGDGGLPPDAHLLDEVEVTGRRRYIDFQTFKAFDAAKDAELMIDEGKDPYKVIDYLRDKGYNVMLPEGQTFDSFMMDYSLNEEKQRLYPPMEDGINDTDNVVSRTIYYQWVSEQAPINGRRTFWFINEKKKQNTGAAFFDGYNLDLDEVKSIIVYDDPMMFSTFPPVRETLSNRLIQDCFERPKSELGFPSGLYIVDIELNPARRLRNFVAKNTRSTTFQGYTPVVEFYAPTYPNGPVQGDKDYRRTIYWNPEVITDSDGRATVSFYNNGYSRAINVSAEGITPDGIPIVERRTPVSSE